MPIDPYMTARFALLEGIESFEEAFGHPEQRARLEQFMGGNESYVSPPVVVQDSTAPGPHGDIPVRIYRPDHAKEPVRPAVVWLHGGGFMGGDLDMPEADIVARELAHRAESVVVSVDYRLAANGVTYPVPHDDVVAAFRWVASQADSLGIDRNRLALGGASAGANLAAGAALRLRDEGYVPGPGHLLLVYPCVHAAVPEASAELAAKLPAVPRVLRVLPETAERITANYLGPGYVDVPPYAMPAEAELAGLPPTTIVNSEYDDLRASGEDFAALLRASGVPVEMTCEDGVLHGHLNTAPHLLAGSDHTLAVLAAAVRGLEGSES